MKRIALGVAASSVLTGCAGIQVQAISADGQHASGVAGLRYYMPRPYLLVTAAPAVVSNGTPKAPTIADPPTTRGPSSGGAVRQGQPPPRQPTTGQTSPPSQGGPPPRDTTPPAGAGDSGDTSKEKSASTDSSKSGASPASDTSYQHLSATYQVKLIYLPDLSRPMTITMSSGLFGTASSQPSLTDGWMLTSLQGSADNKVAETLGALASIVSAAEGGGGAKSTSAKAGAGSDDNPSTDVLAPSAILKPGLYAFDYDKSTGVLKGLCSLNLFGHVAGAGSQVPLCSARDQAAAAAAWQAGTGTQAAK